MGGPTLAAEGLPAETPLAEVFGNTIYPKDLEPPSKGDDLPGRETEIDPEEQLRRDREQLRGLVWSSVFRDYATVHNVQPTDEEVETLYRMTHSRAEEAAKERENETLDAHRAQIQATEEKISQYQKSLETPGLSADEAELLEREIADQRAILERDRELLDYFQSAEYTNDMARAGRNAARGIASQWKLNQALYQEYGGRIIFQQFGWEPIDAYRQVLDAYRDAGKFKILDPRFDGAVYSYFDYDFSDADEEMAQFYFEKPWWQRSEQEMKDSGFMEP